MRILQQKPGPSSWKLWRKSLLLFATKSGKLHVPLGAWTVKPQYQRMLRFTYRDPITEHVYLYNGEHFKKFNVILNKLFHLPKEEQQLYEQLHNNVLPNDIRNSSWLAPRMDPIFHPYISPANDLSIPTSFSEYVNSLPSWMHLYLTHVTILLPLSEVLNLITTESLIYGTDGSAKHNIGSFSWYLSTISGIRLVSNSGECTGRDQYSFRSESQAILSVILFHHHFGNYHEVELPSSIQIYSDSNSFITRYNKTSKRVQSTPNSSSFFLPEWDIFQEINQQMQHHKLQLTVQYVKSHQDKTTTFEELPLEAQLNIQADKLAEIQRLRSVGTSFSPCILIQKLTSFLMKRPSQETSRRVLLFNINSRKWLVTLSIGTGGRHISFITSIGKL